jgi:hypothetical protein
MLCLPMNFFIYFFLNRFSMMITCTMFSVFGPTYVHVRVRIFFGIFPFLEKLSRACSKYLLPIKSLPGHCVASS